MIDTVKSGLRLDEMSTSEDDKRDSVEPEEYGRYTHAWDENNWEKDFDSHPIFRTEPLKEGEEIPPMIEAFQQLKYDSNVNTKYELALNYKEDGNHNFKLKKYRWAVDAYTEGMKVLNQAGEADETEGDEDIGELKSTLLGNRAASHFRLQNYRSSLKDSLDSLKHSFKNSKSMVRVVDCLYELKDYEECIKYGEDYLSGSRIKCLKSDQIESIRTKQQKAREEFEKMKREKMIAEKEEELKDLERQQIMTEVENRGIKFKGSLFESVHPGVSRTVTVKLNQNDEIVWPVIFVYPEFNESDLIEEFNENDSFQDHFQVLFDECNNPGWNASHRYKPDNLMIGFSKFNSTEIVKFDPKNSLKKILSRPDYFLLGANPTFIVTSSGE